MVSGHEHFSIPSQDVDEVEKILTEESKKRNKSSYIVQAIKEKRQRQDFKVLDDFQQPQTELDFLPRLNEPVTKEQLKQLNNKDLGTLHKMIHYNLSVIKSWIDSHEERQGVYVER